MEEALAILYQELYKREAEKAECEKFIGNMEEAIFYLQKEGAKFDMPISVLRNCRDDLYQDKLNMGQRITALTVAIGSIEKAQTPLPPKPEKKKREARPGKTVTAEKPMTATVERDNGEPQHENPLADPPPETPPAPEGNYEDEGGVARVPDPVAGKGLESYDDLKNRESLKSNPGPRGQCDNCGFPFGEDTFIAEDFARGQTLRHCYSCHDALVSRNMAAYRKRRME